VKAVSFRFKLFKLLASPIFNAVIIGSFFVIYCAGQIPFAIYLSCDETQPELAKRVYNGALFLLCLCWVFLVWASDIIENFIFLIKKRVCLIHDDPFYFRLELLLWVMF